MRGVGSSHRALIWSLLAACGVPATGAAPPPELFFDSVHGELVTMARRDPTWVEVGGRRRLLPSLPPGSTLHGVAATREGLALAGDMPAASGRTALVIRQLGSRFERLPPPGRPAAVIREPALLVERGELAGLIWLAGEGPRRLWLEAAAWDGTRWRESVMVSGPGPGSQLALSATVLADGSWLAVWSAFDGEDDEIMWSRRPPGGEWTRPARVEADDGVPDITPVVRAAGQGAQLAWSEYSGRDYRLVVATLADDGWSPPQTLGGRGGVFPTWPAGVAEPVLLFREVETASWVLLELSEQGAPQRVARLSGSPEDRPVVVTEGSRLRLWFPSGRREAPRWQSLR